MSNQVLSISKAGDTTTSLGNLCQCSTAFTVKKFIIHSSFVYFGLCPLPLVLSLGTTKDSPVLSSSLHHQVFMHTDKTPLSLLSCGLSSPSSLSLSLYERCSSPFIIFVALHETLLTRLLVTGSSELSVFCLLISSSSAITTLSGWRSPAENCSYVDVCMKDLPAHAHDASLTACQS